MISKCPYPCENKTNMGYCKTTACINPMFSNIGSGNYSLYPQKRVISNADRIRAMSDEELAEFLEMIPYCGSPSTYTADGFCIDDGMRTKKQWLDWLKQEASE